MLARVGGSGQARKKARPSAAPVFQTLYFRSPDPLFGMPLLSSAPVLPVLANFVARAMCSLRGVPVTGVPNHRAMLHRPWVAPVQVNVCVYGWACSVNRCGHVNHLRRRVDDVAVLHRGWWGAVQGLTHRRDVQCNGGARVLRQLYAVLFACVCIDHVVAQQPVFINRLGGAGGVIL